MDSASPGGVIIRVDKDGNVDQAEVTLDKRYQEVVFWVCADRARNLFIEFEENGPFEAMTKPTNGKRWRVHCQKWMCFSRDIHPDAPGGGKIYKYWQVLENQDGTGKIEVDGRIIIRP